MRKELTIKKESNNNNNNCKQWDGINVIYEIYPPKVADALGLQNLFAYAFENTKITVKIYLRSNISPSYSFRSHRSICLLVTVISLEKMLPRHKTMFVVVFAGVWGKNSLKNWCRYRVQLVLPSFFCTPPSVRDSHFVVASCLPPFVWKTQKNAPVPRNLASSMKLRINDFLFLVFFHITTDGNKQTHQTVSSYLLYCVHFGLAV